MDWKSLKSPSLHGFILGGILLLGLGLRLWQLDAKPLWLDEVLTALFTTGHSYRDVPLERFFSLSELDALFTVRSGLSCPEIAQRVAIESVHPPIFFCLLYAWMSSLQPAEHWVWALRFLPALFGVGTIAALYWLNRIAFSPAAGLLAAALMAVSPFAVYLSQEARHYTLPMLWISLGLVGLVQMQQDLIRRGRLRPLVWVGWSLVNLLGLYTHYFCILALIAQVAALLGWMLGQSIRRRHWAALGLAVAAVGIGYLPWVPTVLSHFSRPETDWLIPYKPDWLDRLEPLYQTLVGWTLMVIALPVEDQPKRIALPLALLMLGFMLWLTWQIRKGSHALWCDRSSRPAALLLLGFTGCVLLQFFAIVYLLDKDLTVVPRYNFVYYPGVCALLAACLMALPASRTRLSVLVVLLAGLISSIGVVNGLTFQKSYRPNQVAQNLASNPTRPLAVVMTYTSPQEVALGLSFALELRSLYPAASLDSQVQFAFLDRSSGYDDVRRSLVHLPQPLPAPLNLWVFGSPGMRTKNFPQELRLSVPPTATTRNRARCAIDPEGFHRLGFPYQRFRCDPIERSNERPN
ncbi:MAG: glycosyltransferase family 39 protein [Synechococcales cyanobacterium C42_A2020_086]|nr:glycosyltransferase family 39 protein [Synechococcales cyanobacterium C42_A2020_086]